MVNIDLISNLVGGYPQRIRSSHLAGRIGVVLANEVCIGLVELDDAGAGILGRPHAGLTELHLGGNDFSAGRDGKAGTVSDKLRAIILLILGKDGLFHVFFSFMIKLVGLISPQNSRDTFR